MLRAIILDFDGLIADTEITDFTSWQEVFAAHGQELDIDVWSLFIGTRGGFDPYALLEELTGAPVDRPAIQVTRRAREAELRRGIMPLPGVEARLLEARASALQVGLASSAADAWVVEHLDRFRLGAYFDTVVCSGTSLPSKPDPAVYSAALDRLGVRPEAAIAFEDSPNGIAAAKAAGMRCVAVPNQLTARLDLSAADGLYRSMAAFTLADLDRLFWPRSAV